MNTIKEQAYIDQLTARYPALEALRAELAAGYALMEDCFARGGKLLAAGNGGSAADAEHVVGELMKRFCLPRPVSPELARRLRHADPQRGDTLAQCLERPLTAIALVGHEALTTAYSNDVDSACVYAQQLLGYGREGDVLLAISTSGNSENVLHAAVAAKALGISVLALTGGSGGALAKLADVTVCVPETQTYKIQELHLPIYHCWCMMLEEQFFGQGGETQ